jgi:hypothetical protein
MKSIITALAVLILACPGGAWALDGQSIIDLKHTGLGDKTIQLIIQEKVVETGAFTVKEIIALKTSGLSEETIQMVIKEGSFMPDAQTIIYGQDTKPIKFASIKDIKSLKAAGFSDEVIQAIIIYGTRDSGDIERDRAWRMLQGMGIIIDQR